MKLFLIRHGQTEANLNRIYSGQTDVQLTETGREQAAAIRPLLANMTFDRVYSSDLSRAIDTQRLALPGVEGERTALLREIDVGRAAGCTWGQVPCAPEGWSSARDDDPYVCVGGESRAQVKERVTSFLQMLEEAPCDRVVAFAHGGIISTMMRIVLGDGILKGSFNPENCSIHVFEHDGTRWKLLAFNYMKEF